MLQHGHCFVPGMRPPLSHEKTATCSSGGLRGRPATGALLAAPEHGPVCTCRRLRMALRQTKRICYITTVVYWVLVHNCQNPCICQNQLCKTVISLSEASNNEGGFGKPRQGAGWDTGEVGRARGAQRGQQGWAGRWVLGGCRIKAGAGGVPRKRARQGGGGGSSNRSSGGLLEHLSEGGGSRSWWAGGFGTRQARGWGSRRWWAGQEVAHR